MFLFGGAATQSGTDKSAAEEWQKQKVVLEVSAATILKSQAKILAMAHLNRTVCGPVYMYIDSIGSNYA